MSSPKRTPVSEDSPSKRARAASPCLACTDSLVCDDCYVPVSPSRREVYSQDPEDAYRSEECPDCSKEECICLLTQNPPCQFSNYLFRESRYVRIVGSKPPKNDNLVEFLYLCYHAACPFTLPQLCRNLAAMQQAACANDNTVPFLLVGLTKSHLRAVLSTRTDIWKTLPPCEDDEYAFECKEASVDSQRYKWCGQHACKGGTDCILEPYRYGDPSANVCHRHVCDFFSCTEAKKVGDADFCEAHACKMHCGKPVSFSNPHNVCRCMTPEKHRACSACSTTKCHFRLCRGDRKRDSHFCKDHAEKCANYENCLGRGKYVEAAQRVLCMDCIKCRKCHRVEGVSSKKHKYCNECGCAREDCNNPREDGHKVCAECMCASKDCKNMTLRLRKGAFCVLCRCSRQDCEDQRSPNSQYCIRHTCRSKNCLTPLLGAAQEIRGFCGYHMCLWTKTACDKQRLIDKIHCEDHSCFKSGCMSAQETEHPNACWKHTCKQCHAKVQDPVPSLLCAGCENQ